MDCDVFITRCRNLEWIDWDSWFDGLPGGLIRLAPRILEGMSQERACPKHFKGHVPRAGLSQAF